MDDYKTFSITEMKRQHLWAQHEHLHYVREYHLWMGAKTTDSAISELHRTMADQLSQVIALLDKMLKALQSTPSVETTPVPITSCENMLTPE
jgi:hypothetical protein